MSQVRDPVCGMLIDSTAAAGTSTWEGKTWYFCSSACKAKFDADPASYTGGHARKPMRRAEPPFTTDGPFTAPKFGSAGSGGAEYEPGPDQRLRP